jgi:ribosomal protein S18 acetylase RimI-like enzyme
MAVWSDTVGRGEWAGCNLGVKTSHTGGVTGFADHVRRATAHDLDAVLTFVRTTHVGADHSDLLGARVNAGEVIIYEQYARVLGLVSIRPQWFFGRDFVELLSVGEDARRRGVGTTLLQAAVQGSPLRRTFTSTNQSNLPMIGLLDKAHWEFSGQLDGIDDDDPELIYYKD